MKVKTLDDFMKGEIIEKGIEKTEVQGPYELPEGWKWVKLGEVVHIRKDIINPQEYPEEEFELYSIPAYHKTGKPEIKLGKEIRSAKVLVRAKDCLFGKLNPHIPKVWLVEPFKGKRQIASTELFPLVPKAENVIPEFLFWFLRTSYFRDRMIHKVIGTTGSRKRLSKNDVLEERIPLPPFEEQKRIVSRLEELISRAEEAKRLRKLAREEAEKIMQAALNKVFSKAEEKGWKWVKLSELILIESGKRPKGGATKTGVPSLGGEQLLPNGEVEWKKLRYIPEDFFDTLRKGKVRVGDVLVVKDGATTGKTAYVKDLPFKKVAVNEHVFILRSLNESQLLNEYLFFVLFSDVGQKQIRKLFHGAAQGGITQRNVKEILIPLPPLEEQKNIVTYLDRIRENVRHLKAFQQRTEEELEKLIPTILDKAFRGEL